ncbi:hypothetical protein A9Q99_01380 [Gammaproteobacteria bacterium 45_16_T64]|nr:hypothetical protein A9Q99_01380 [Gammaproteobacteria bacterium 45_16_T64]
MVLITGGGRGIGRETAIAFSAQGAYIILIDVNEEGMEETGRLIFQAGGSVEKHRVDVTSRRDMKALSAKVKHRHGALDVLINNAGIGSAGTFLETTLDTWDKSY